MSAHSPVHDAPHKPVLLNEVLQALAVTPGQIVVDGTFGAGGYSRAILAAGAQVHAFDRDPDAIARGADLAGMTKGGLLLYPARFSAMQTVMAAQGITEVDAVVLDIGVSSMQLDERERGFSFQSDGPLDMRMEQSGESAADFLNTASETDIADIIYHFGDERQSRRIARAIVAARPLERTGQLAQIVRGALGYRPGMPKDPATRTFQAIRIHINAELDELREGLAAAEKLLRPGGRLVVVTFHSLEDRIVKLFLRERSGSGPAGSRHRPAAGEERISTFEKPAKAVRPSEAEIQSNPRARSATLRAAIRTGAPAWDQTGGSA